MFRKTWVVFIIIFIIAGIFSGAFLYASHNEYAIGYPLDDAWIHQTFARNLVEYRNWSYNPGELAAGSTAPLWTSLISLGYLAGIDHLIWTYLLGILGLALVGLLSYLFLQMIKVKPWLSLAISTLLIGEWHLVWAAVSGMEIILLTVIVIAIFIFVNQKSPHWWLIGILIGISVWCRPDGITLLAPVLWIWFWNHHKNKVITLTKLLLPVFVLSALYLFFNYQISGSILPNTFYAKQKEYAELLHQPFIYRLWNMVKTILAGPGVIWIIGFFAGIILSFREKKYSNLAPYLWILGYILIYATRLPVYYQHGRYLMPILGVLILFSVSPLMKLVQTINHGRIRFILSRVIALTLCFVTVGFLFIGAKAYAKDTAVIEQQMVRTAKWVAENTPNDALIAAHDIGALGYFGNRRILDLAGLITPEVIPFIRDSRMLSSYIVEKKADYLIVFPDWYNPSINVQGKVVFQAGGNGTSDQDFNLMEVIELQ